MSFLDRMTTDEEPASPEKLLSIFARKNEQLRKSNEHLLVKLRHDHLFKELQRRTKHLRRFWKQNRSLKRQIKGLQKTIQDSDRK